MFGRFRKKKPRLTELTWEEKHPIDYLFGPSDEDIKWLEEKIKKDKEIILKSTVKEQYKGKKK